MPLTTPVQNHVAAPEEIDLDSVALFHSGDPAAAWRILRDTTPVVRQVSPTGFPYWSVTRYADVVAVLKDSRRFTSRNGTGLSVLEGDIAGGKAVNLMDAPEHAWIRSPSIRKMSAKVMREQETRIRSQVADIVRSCVTQGECDFAKMVATLPMIASGDIIGIHPEDWADVVHWTMAGVAPEDPVFAVGDSETTLRQAHLNLFQIVYRSIQDCQAEPGDDLISMLLELDFGGRALTEQEIVLNCYSFIMGANITTGHVASHFALAMMRYPEVWRQLKADRSMLPGVLEEALRWATPAIHLVRQATEDVDLAGVRIAEGDMVCTWVGSANRDETVFEDPDTFDPRRSPNPHIAFGIGPHYCVGGFAARAVLSALITELLDQVDHIEPTGPELRLHSNFVSGITSLPVRVHPVA